MEDRDNYRQRLGCLGENAACSLLESMGHMILERNWRCGHLEIDIISVDHEGIHFVEVKARQKSVQAPPQENVDRRKQGRIVKAALGYLNTAKGLPRKDMECFFDVVAVTFEGDRPHVEWIPQAYIPIYV